MEIFFGLIYQFTNNINGKMYIGKTINTKEEKRLWYLYAFNTMLKQKTVNTNRTLFKAFLKYGFDNFKFDIIECLIMPTKEMLDLMLNDREAYWISTKGTFGNSKIGYNETAGGDGGRHSESVKKKNSIKNIERFSDPNERKKQAERTRNFFKNNPDKRNSANSYIDTNGNNYVSLNQLEEKTGISVYLLKRDYIDKDKTIESINATVNVEKSSNRIAPNKVEISQEIKDKVKYLRMEKRMTKPEIGKELGLSEPIIYRICRELNLPSFRVPQKDFSNSCFVTNNPSKHKEI
jgi:group I intron endonuclease